MIRLPGICTQSYVRTVRGCNEQHVKHLHYHMACLNSSVLPPASGCALRIRSRKACKEVYPQAGSTAEDQAGKQQQHSCEQTSADGAGVSKFGSLFLDAGGSGSANLNVSPTVPPASDPRGEYQAQTSRSRHHPRP